MLVLLRISLGTDPYLDLRDVVFLPVVAYI